MTTSELIEAIENRLSTLSPRLQAAPGSSVVQGARATPAQATTKLQTPGQPEKGIVRFDVQIPSSSNRNLTREGSQGVEGGIIVRDTVVIIMTAPTNITNPGTSRHELLDVEVTVLKVLTDPSWSRALRLSYTGTQRNFSPVGQGAQSQITLTFTVDRQFP